MDQNPDPTTTYFFLLRYMTNQAFKYDGQSEERMWSVKEKIPTHQLKCSIRLSDTDMWKATKWIKIKFMSYLTKPLSAYFSENTVQCSYYFTMLTSQFFYC